MPKNIHEKLDIKIGSSRRIDQLVTILFVCAFAASWLNDLPKEYRCLMSFLVIVFWVMRNISKQSSLYFLRYTTSLGWALSSDGTDYREIFISDGTVITCNAIFLCFKTKAQFNKAIFIASDSVSANDYRSLIVRLKLSRQVEPNE